MGRIRDKPRHTLVLGQGYDFIQPGGGTVALAVDNVKAALEELEQLDIQIHSPLGESPVCFWAIIKDPMTAIVSFVHQRKDGTVG